MVTSDYQLPKNPIKLRTLLLKLMGISFLVLVLSSSEMEDPHPTWQLCTPLMDKTHGTFLRTIYLTIFLLLKVLHLSFLQRNSLLELLSSNTLVFLILPSMAKMVNKSQTSNFPSNQSSNPPLETTMVMISKLTSKKSLVKSPQGPLSTVLWPLLSQTLPRFTLEILSCRPNQFRAISETDICSSSIKI